MREYTEEEQEAFDKLGGMLMRLSILGYINSDIEISITNGNGPLLTLFGGVGTEVGSTDIEQQIINRLAQLRKHIQLETREIIGLVQKRADEVEAGSTYGMSVDD